MRTNWSPEIEKESIDYHMFCGHDGRSGERGEHMDDDGDDDEDEDDAVLVLLLASF